MPQTGQGHMAWAVRVDNNKVDKVSLSKILSILLICFKIWIWYHTRHR